MNKTAHLIFRIVVFLVAILSIVSFVMFVQLVMNDDIELAWDAPKSDLARITYSGLMFLIAIVLSWVSLILSIVSFKFRGTANGVVRTLFIAIVAIMGVIIFKFAKDYYISANIIYKQDYAGAVNKYNDIISYTDIKKNAIMYLITWVSTAVVYFILAITSIVSLVKGPKAASIAETNNNSGYIPPQPQYQPYGQQNQYQQPYNGQYQQNAYQQPQYIQNQYQQQAQYNQYQQPYNGQYQQGYQQPQDTYQNPPYQN